MLKLAGPLVVNPQRPGDFKKQHKLKTVVVELACRGLAPYYINRLRKEFGPWLNLSPPMFGLHVTVVKGTETFNERAAHQLAGKTICLDVDPTTLARTDWSREHPGFWTMRVVGQEVQALRHHLHVKTDRYGMNPHLTVARENNVFFMPARRVEQAELPALVDKLLTLVPDRFGNQGFVFDLRRFQKLCNTKLVTGDDLVKLVHQHVNFPLKTWEKDVLQLFKRK